LKDNTPSSSSSLTFLLFFNGPTDGGEVIVDDGGDGARVGADDNDTLEGAMRLTMLDSIDAVVDRSGETGGAGGVRIGELEGGEEGGGPIVFHHRHPLHHR
jgi:hypothetical protein